jgi:hypothetical protein
LPHNRAHPETLFIYHNAHARQNNQTLECNWISGKQGRWFRFVNRSKEPYEWTDCISEDDPEFQGLLEDEEAPFPDISTELPGVSLEEDKSNFQVVTNKPEPDFEDVAAAALENAGINTVDQLCTA